MLVPGIYKALPGSYFELCMHCLPGKRHNLRKNNVGSNKQVKTIHLEIERRERLGEIGVNRADRPILY